MPPTGTPSVRNPSSSSSIDDVIRDNAALLREIEERWGGF
jgi:hypothetical protein